MKPTHKPTDQRVRGRALTERRERYFQMNPLCVHCEQAGRYTAAAVIDHIRAFVNGGSDDPSNWQGLCRPCHEIKTRLDLGQRPKRVIGPDGWPT